MRRSTRALADTQRLEHLESDDLIEAGHEAVKRRL
jgi:hypothetical protein